MRGVVASLLAVSLLAGCAGEEQAVQDDEPQEVAFGPVDGHDLPGVDLERVQVGQAAPDFTLMSLDGSPLTLSSFRGEKNVVLVFYRGHW